MDASWMVLTLRYFTRWVAGDRQVETYNAQLVELSQFNPPGVANPKIDSIVTWLLCIQTGNRNSDHGQAPSSRNSSTISILPCRLAPSMLETKHYS